MSSRQQRIAILAATIGDGDHPEELATRRAANRLLKRLLGGEELPPLQVLREFVISLVEEQTLVEAIRQLDAGETDAAAVARKEQGVRSWIRRRLRDETFGIVGGVVQRGQYAETARRLVRTALRILRGG
jgi:hypothetical protein